MSNMKTIRYISVVLVLLSFLVTSCQDFNYENLTGKGNPTIKATTVSSAQMGDSIDVKVNCSDTEGYDLSTLKAEMCYSGEPVNAVTIRTKTPGDYTVRLHVPFIRFIPNGTAQVRLTLQNVTTRTVTQDIDIAVTRPHFNNLQFVTSDGVVYPMTEGSDYTYTCVTPITDNAFKGNFQTADGKYKFGWGDNDVAENGNGFLSFQSNKTGYVTVNFNSRDFTYGPQEVLLIQPLQFRNSDGMNIYTGTLTQGSLYKFIGDAQVQSDSWYYDPDFFTRNADGTFTFTALTGTYTIKAVFEENGFRIFAVNGKDPATLNADGTGAVWIIGGDMFGKPTFAHAQGWWTDTDHALCMAPVADKVYQVTFTIGKQLKPGTNVDFKFFGQAGWGTEFKASGDHAISADNPWFYVNAADGNIHLKDGVVLKSGETYKFTLDLTKGVANGKVNVEKTDVPTLNFENADGKNIFTGTLIQGNIYEFVGDAAVKSADWYYDPDFFTRNSDGSYTFNAITGTYNIKAVFAQNGFRIYPTNGADPAKLNADGTGAIWLIGDAIFGKPNYSNAQSWSTDTDHALSLAPIKPKVYQMTLTVGKQLKAGNSVNFKFFGQAGWGTEFKGKAADHYLTTTNTTFLIGDGTGGHDDGNIYLQDGLQLTDGETYVFTIDCSKGMAPATLSVQKK